MANPQKENGYTPIANEIVDCLMKTQLNGYQSRLLWAIWRKTYGYNKTEDWISNTKFIELTGMNKSHICRTIRQLLAKNIVAKNGNKIKFNKNYSQWIRLPKLATRKQLPKLVIPVAQNGNSVLPKLAVTKDNLTKDNITKDNGEIKISPTQTMLDFIQMVSEKNEKYPMFISSLAERRGVGVEIVRAELDKFINYWCEASRNGKKQRWEMEKTFEVQRRLVTWFGNIRKFQKSTPQGLGAFIS